MTIWTCYWHLKVHIFTKKKYIDFEGHDRDNMDAIWTRYRVTSIWCPYSRSWIHMVHNMSTYLPLQPSIQWYGVFIDKREFLIKKLFSSQIIFIFIFAVQKISNNIHICIHSRQELWILFVFVIVQEKPYSLHSKFTNHSKKTKKEDSLLKFFFKYLT